MNRYPTPMKTTPAMITLTPENSEGITKLAALIGWSPDQLANHLLGETLETFANESSGALEGFLGAIYYPDRESAQRALDRVTQMTRGEFGGRLPESFKSELFECPDGRFDFRAEYTDRCGEFYRI